MEAPEIRIDQLTGSRVLVTPDRSHRPDDFTNRPWTPGAGEGCPFCEGAETPTPPEVDADRPGDSEPNGPG